MVYRQHLENLWCLFYKETNPKPLQPSYFLKLLPRLSYGGGGLSIHAWEWTEASRVQTPKLGQPFRTKTSWLAIEV